MPALSGYRWPLRVYYEDTDCGGVVYHASYLKFMERARTEWLRGLGYEQDRLVKEMDVIFAVHSMEIQFQKPARFNDQLIVTARPLEVRSASLLFEQCIVRPADGFDEEELMVTAQVRIACVSASELKPLAIPVTLRQVLKRASGS